MMIAYNRLQPSAVPLSLRFETNSQYFLLGPAFLYHVREKRHFHLAVRRSLSPPASLPLLRSFSDGPLLCPISSIPLSFRRETLRSSWRCLQSFIQYKNDTVSSRVPDLKAEDLCRPSRIPFFAKRVQMTLSRVIDKMVVDEGRALQPCRYRLFTHMSCIILYPYSTQPCRGYTHVITNTGGYNY